ncbi:hypothetical protein BB560_002885 [Smittium megazygosporum]|uniref:C3H1-type domain-containing protein n=1 Tax=Smittium megazygosporum TaxID=133381 RepID=A0A2T9ZDI0_9FUNG|nr:hypothetical protein BB560_002885 [Smittium megazygosporum]
MSCRYFSENTKSFPVQNPLVAEESLSQLYHRSLIKETLEESDDSSETLDNLPKSQLGDKKYSMSKKKAPTKPTKAQPTKKKGNNNLSSPSNKDDLSDENTFKTELCNKWTQTGHCAYGDLCRFAHGISELKSRTRHPKYRTSICNNFSKYGYCPYESRCDFVHVISKNGKIYSGYNESMKGESKGSNYNDEPFKKRTESKQLSAPQNNQSMPQRDIKENPTKKPASTEIKLKPSLLSNKIASTTNILDKYIYDMQYKGYCINETEFGAIPKGSSPLNRPERFYLPPVPIEMPDQSGLGYTNQAISQTNTQANLSTHNFSASYSTVNRNPSTETNPGLLWDAGYYNLSQKEKIVGELSSSFGLMSLGCGTSLKAPSEKAAERTNLYQNDAFGYNWNHGGLLQPLNTTNESKWTENYASNCYYTSEKNDLDKNYCLDYQKQLLSGPLDQKGYPFQVYQGIVKDQTDPYLLQYSVPTTKNKSYNPLAKYPFM